MRRSRPTRLAQLPPCQHPSKTVCESHAIHGAAVKSAAPGVSWLDVRSFCSAQGNRSGWKNDAGNRTVGYFERCLDEIGRDKTGSENPDLESIDYFRIVGYPVETQCRDAPFGVVSTHGTVSSPSVSAPRNGGVPEELGKNDMTLRLIDFGEDAERRRSAHCCPVHSSHDLEFSCSRRLARVTNASTERT
jgi:hypothetical protein